MIRQKTEQRLKKILLKYFEYYFKNYSYIYYYSKLYYILKKYYSNILKNICILSSQKGDRKGTEKGSMAKNKG